jgi:hypothetical protein
MTHVGFFVLHGTPLSEPGRPFLPGRIYKRIRSRSTSKEEKKKYIKRPRTELDTAIAAPPANVIIKNGGIPGQRGRENGRQRMTTLYKKGRRGLQKRETSTGRDFWRDSEPAMVDRSWFRTGPGVSLSLGCNRRAAEERQRIFLGKRKTGR